MNTTLMNATLQRYRRILEAKWRWVAWGVIGAIAIMAVLLILLPPTYRTTATVFIRTPGDVSQSMDGGDLYAQSRAETYAALASSTGVASRVVADMGLNLSAEKLARRVQAHHIGRTTMFQVKVSAPSADEARRTTDVLLNELSVDATALETVPGGLLPRAELVVVDPPSPPTRVLALRAPLYLVVITAIVAGAFLGALAAVIRSRATDDDAADAGAHAPGITTELEGL